MVALTDFRHLTFWDAVDWVIDQMVGADSSARNRRLAVQAVREAYEEIPSRRNWRYYYRSLSLHTAASETTGTITYDYTGGSSERLVTRSTGTLPTDLEKYALIVAGKRYGIDTRLSSTTFTLDEKDCPTTDLDAGTVYTLVRDTYELPSNCRKLLSLYDTSAPGRMIACVDPGDIVREQRIVRTGATPNMYSVFRSERYSGALAIHFAPSPTSALVYQCYGLFDPLELTTLDYSGIGTVATTADSSTVTGTDTGFVSAHAGAVMRFSSTGNLKIPTDIQGETDKNRLEPYAMQRIIKSRASATSLTLESPADLTLSGSGYRISSRIDIENGAMRNAFLRCCLAKFATQDRKGMQEREAAYERAFALASYADSRMEDSAGPPFIPSSLVDFVGSVDNTLGGTQP